VAFSLPPRRGRISRTPAARNGSSENIGLLRQYFRCCSRPDRVIKHLPCQGASSPNSLGNHSCAHALIIPSCALSAIIAEPRAREESQSILSTINTRSDKYCRYNHNYAAHRMRCHQCRDRY
jgi:hypothetical protein